MLKRILAAVVTVAIVVLTGIAFHQNQPTTIQGWNFEGMAQACALEEKHEFCLSVVEGMRTTHTQMMWVAEERPEIGAEDRARFVTHYRIKLNEEKMWATGMFPKMWAAHIQR